MNSLIWGISVLELKETNPFNSAAASLLLFQTQFPPFVMTSVVDFSKLSETALRKYVAHYNITVRENLSKDDLGVLVAKHFQLEAAVRQLLEVEWQ